MTTATSDAGENEVTILARITQIEGPPHAGNQTRNPPRLLKARSWMRHSHDAPGCGQVAAANTATCPSGDSSSPQMPF